ncbi:hypothetical protein MBLNU230_g1007t1 [Neophaeotheca triangularis]
MHLRHGLTHLQRRTLSRWPLTLILLVILWIYVLHWGERTVFKQHIEQCHWNRWETWPSNAKPHRMAMVADPQIVDPHTYPGRPWPLSSLTELYTDSYMARNFRLINAELDPDTIAFLGDLFDGGREWATAHAKPLRESQRKKLEKLGITKDSKKAEDGHMSSKRSLESYHAALSAPHSRSISRSEHNLAKDGTDLRAFVHGENGRWSKWSQPQWEMEFERFGRIFFATDQLYPGAKPDIFEAFDVVNDPISVENGAIPSGWHEYATTRSKQRHILTTLPGNHDVGFGSGVQLSVRDRFHGRFGESNRVDVIGNHTFVSLDTPSLSAMGQFEREGGETKSDARTARKHIWSPSYNFLETVKDHVTKANTDALSECFPAELESSKYHHEVTKPDDLESQPHPSKLSSDTTPQLPMVLLSHVPLWRERGFDCGKYRERGSAIPIAFGYQYQNVLTRELTNFIIKKASLAGNIVQAFSGDDHDYCDVMHKYNVDRSKPTDKKPRPVLASVREITVKSFSWAMGVRKPGFQLVSLWNPVDEHGRSLGNSFTPTIQTHLCLLPDQLSIFITYLLLLSFTLLILLLRATIIALRQTNPFDNNDNPFYTPLKPLLARWSQFTNSDPATPTAKPKPRSRTRASSTSASTPEQSNRSSTTNLGVQRSYNARTRSVSPAAPHPQHQNLPSPFPEKPSHLQVRWQDPDSSDEESHIGVSDYDYDDYDEHGGDVDELGKDSQAKWKFKQRRFHKGGRARKVFGEFVKGVGFVGVPGLVWYLWLVRRG